MPFTFRSVGAASAAAAFAASVLVGCSGGDALETADEASEHLSSQAESTLRERFPSHAAPVLDARDAFVVAVDGFTLDVANAPSRGSHARPRSSFSRLAEDGVRFEIDGRSSIRVRELGAFGEGTIAGHAVAYSRRGGTSYWTAVDGGFEEWLLLDAGVATGERPVAEWEIEGGAFRQVGDTVAVVDDGWVKLHVAAPRAYTASGRAIEARLSVTDGRLALWADAGGEAALVDPSWTTLAPMSSARESAAITLLSNGRVLVAGGKTPVSPYIAATVEVYDVAANTWATAAPMSVPRMSAASARLPDGRVLVAGGRSTDGTVAMSLSSAELYDPVVNSWTSAGSMPFTSWTAWGRLLANGKVLVCGSTAGDGPSASCALYTSASNSWAPAASMSLARTTAAVTMLQDGRVLVAGGFTAAAQTTSAEIYDPVTNAWSPAAPLATGRNGAGAVVLASGKVILAGGSSGAGYLSSAELYTPALNSWVPAGSMSGVPRISTAGAALLGSGRALFAGGYKTGGGSNDADVFDPLSMAWSAAPPMTVPRDQHTAIPLPSGGVLVVGSGVSQPLGAIPELYYEAAQLGAACAAASECLSGFCADAVCCNAACNSGPCDACSVAAGAAVNGTCTALTGPACNDGNACTQTDTCQSGACVGAAPVLCSAQDACHTVGVCDAATGLCSNPTKANGVPCSDGDACTLSDTCQLGVCTGASPVLCFAQDGCHAAGTCNPATGSCSNPPKSNGAPCDDGSACTQTDTCQAGTCVGTNPVACDASACQAAGTCNPATATCSGAAKPNGTACNDGDACTQTDACQAGACVGSNPVTCVAPNACTQTPSCDPATGACASPLPKVDGTACDDGNACTASDACLAGVCAGTNPVVCGAPDPCHVQGACDPSTGVCSKPSEPDGTGCDDGDACTEVDTCQDGVCASGLPTSCPAPDECHDPGECDPGTGACSNPQKMDGTTCDDGDDCTSHDACQSGACVGPVQAPNTCADNHTVIDCRNGKATDCGTYRCSVDACLHECTTVDDCAPPNVCDAETKQCVASSDPPASTDAGGCSCGVSGSPTAGGFWLSLGACILMRRRTSRRRVVAR